jgi:hypothetical protein
MRLRLAELIAALSLATDLGLGLPQEHVLRQCRIALGLAEHLGVDPAERAAVHYVAMLAWVGCTADSHELAAQFGDELALRADPHEVDLAGLPMMGFLLRRVGAGRPPLRRAQMAAALVASGGRGAAEAMAPAPGWWRSPRRSPRASPPAPRSTTATAATRSRRSTR